MNSSAFGSKSLSRKGEGSMASNNCFSSLTCTSMTAQLGGIASPAKSFTSALEVFVITCPAHNQLGRDRYNHHLPFNFIHVLNIGQARPIEMMNVWPRIHELPKQTTRWVHRLPAIILRRWQAEEIAKTPFPRVSRSLNQA